MIKSDIKSITVDQKKEREALIEYIKASGINIESFDSISLVELRQLVERIFFIEEEYSNYIKPFNTFKENINTQKDKQISIDEYTWQRTAKQKNI